MNYLTESYVDGLALNGAAMKNGKDLARKNSFPKLRKSPDGELLFGECKGSGKEPYRCSADFVKPDSPVFRCSCPSRQFPCKHILGLLYAYTAGQAFDTEEIPPDIAEKREKAEKREEKKKEAAASAGSDTEAGKSKRKTNKNALVKKIAAQLEGLDLLEKLVHQLVQSGLGSVDAKTLKMLAEQSKQLGNYYIPGVQAAFKQLLLQLEAQDNKETIYTLAVEQLTLLHTLIKKGREHLIQRMADPDMPMDTETTLEEWLGHAWQLAELREHDRVQKETKLLQLSFRSYTDEARGEYVDEGVWMELQSGHIHITRTYRPFRAAKFIREDDSVFDVIQPTELFVYPGELNARIRWEEASFRPAQPDDYVSVQSRARSSYPEAVKQVKNQIKNPLSDKQPVLLLAFDEIQQSEEEDLFILLDPQGKSLVLADLPGEQERTTPLLPLLPKEALKGQTMLVKFGHDMKLNRLAAQPLSIITPTEVIRLQY
ncbi:SWIM zinc finger family protein [Paenibacillus rigui]|uniref:SWIM-type domain-containing protein n=1 Tax=Paenibacillus rigui TaxID=554312 RepID=A0A229UKT8_9BACL|nr:SWIM zinc finger family protein [Paenibacillus rigui]OXM83519.1 hypothetical protein CF651_25325 [Paenibacillus rigui]